MSENQHFCLKWNNHQSTLVSLFPSLLDTNTFVDCTLAAGGKQLHAHKVVLSACSPYFKELLVQHNDKHPIIILNNIKASELVAIVDFMYKGEVNISQENLAEFLKAAKTLQIKGLTDSEKDGKEEICDDDTYEESVPQKVTNLESEVSQNEVDSIDRKSSRLQSPNNLVVGDVLSSSGNYSENSVNNVSSIKLENWEDDDSVYGDKAKPDQRTTQVPFSVPVNLSETLFPDGFMKNDYYPNFLSGPIKNLFRMPVLQNLKEDNSESSILGGRGVFSMCMGRSNSTEATFSCETCNKRYRSKTSLNLHRRWECGKEPRFSCPFCDKRTHQKGNLKVHIMSRHRDKISVGAQSSNMIPT